MARLLNVPLVVQAGRGDVNAITARAARVAERTLCATVSLREALVEQGAPPSTTSVMRGLLDEKTDLSGGGIFPPMLDTRMRWVVSAAPCDGPDRGHADLLLAFLSLARTRPRLQLLIAGSGATARALLAQADQAGAAFPATETATAPALQPTSPSSGARSPASAGRRSP